MVGNIAYIHNLSIQFFWQDKLTWEQSKHTAMSLNLIDTGPQLHLSILWAENDECQNYECWTG